MKRRGRVRRAAKWAGLSVSLLIAAAWVTSARYEILCRFDTRPRKYTLHLECGVFNAWGGIEKAYAPARTSFRRKSRWDFIPPRPLPRFAIDSRGFGLTLPLWLPLVLTAVPGVWLWRLDRRASPGCCAACGYDLAGLTPGAACPECGSGKSSKQQSSTLK
ncbi:MAG: hypothetical protein ACKVU4_10360 [Phycisphaerales bacterium]